MESQSHVRAISTLAMEVLPCNFSTDQLSKSLACLGIFSKGVSFKLDALQKKLEKHKSYLRFRQRNFVKISKQMLSETHSIWFYGQQVFWI